MHNLTSKTHKTICTVNISKINNVQTLFTRPKFVHLCHGLELENVQVFFFALYVLSYGADKQSIYSKGKRNFHSAQSVFVESEPHILITQIFPLIYSYILYTPSLSAYCVQPCKCACALPGNSLHSNPCKGT